MLEATVIEKAQALAAKVRVLVAKVKVLVAKVKVLAEARIKEALELGIIEALAPRVPVRRVPVRRARVPRVPALVVTNVVQVKLDKVLLAVVRRVTLPKRLPLKR